MHTRSAGPTNYRDDPACRSSLALLFSFVSPESLPGALLFSDIAQSIVRRD